MIFNPNWLAEVTCGQWVKGAPASIKNFSFDARSIGAGECFIALSSGLRDGHGFADQAREHGAAAIIVERIIDVDLPQLLVLDSLAAIGAIGAGCREAFRSTGPVVGITGSCGKTSTKEMLRYVLGPAQTHATPGNWNNLIGVPMTLCGMDPEVHKAAVIEAGINQPGEMARLGQMINADLTICTNIGSAHLELLGSLEGVATEKSKLVQFSEPDAPLMVPGEVLDYRSFAPYRERAFVLVEDGGAIDVAIPCEKRTFYRLESLGEGSTKLILRNDHAFSEFQIPSVSQGICQNAGLVIIAARTLGLSDSIIAKRLKMWRPSENRGGVVIEGARSFYVDAYNANPTSMADALKAFERRFPSALPRCYILGAMNELGQDSAAMHRSVGGLCVFRPQDSIYCVGPEPLVDAYREGALAAGFASKQIFMANSVDCIRSAVESFEGALFLKGSRTYALESLLPSNS